MKTRLIVALCLAVLVTTPLTSFAQTSITAHVTLDADVASEPLTGRLLLFFSKRMPQPMFGPNWFGAEPFFRMDVSEMKPGDSVTFDDSAISMGEPLSKLADGSYNIQVVLDHDFFYANHASGPGNYFSEPARVTIQDGKPTEPIQLTLNQVVGEKQYEDTDNVKFVEIDSKLLADFHDRPVVERAMVVLPNSYHDHPERRYPVYVVVTGFGGTLERLQQRWQRGLPEPAEGEAEFIRVYLTGQCKWGHHVYANSATNGPRGDMLVREMIPEIDKRFRTIAETTARFVGGHSSGGWSSLWLQVTYPDTFGGVWSTAPDPVDFRDWQGTNIYEKGANVYYRPNGEKRPLARRGETVMVHYEDFTRMDDVMGRGGQIRSFDAVFSPLDEDGLPAHCWDRKTGEVNPDVLEHWKQYDISLKLQRNWKDLGPKLESRIHVYMGDLDTFYLEGATIKLGERLKELGSDAVVEIFPGKDHGSLMTRDLRSRIAREMSEQFWKAHPPEDVSDNK